MINASGELPGGRKFNSAEQLTKILGETEAAAFAKTFTERLLTFALGRELTPLDRCVVDEIMTNTADSNHAMVDVILEVIRSQPFQYYDWPSAESTNPRDTSDRRANDE